MANTKSAKKMVRKITTRTARNKSRRSQMRGTIRVVETAIINNDKSAAILALKNAQPKIMRAAQKGALHARTAARKISRLARRINNINA